MIKERLQSVKSEIDKARMRRIGKMKDEPVKLVAVTKNHGIEAMREAIDAGVTDIGENRIQEAVSKYDKLDRDVRWHLIGHLQTNKAKQAVRYFDVIHSVDSKRLALAVNQAAEGISKVQDVLIQVNLAREESKSGVFREDLDELEKFVAEQSNLRLCGLMCIAPNYENVEECRPIFREMNEIFLQLKEKKLSGANIMYLSMGMTHDFPVAVEEGANIVRVGTAIFGLRQYT